MLRKVWPERFFKINPAGVFIRIYFNKPKYCPDYRQKQMKFPIAYYLMLLYLTVMFKPLIPVISDALSHTFEDAIHIATVHSIYGNNHLEVELAATGSDNDASKNQDTTKTPDPMPVHVSEEASNYDFSLNEADKHYPSLFLYNLQGIFISKDAPPPKFA